MPTVESTKITRNNKIVGEKQNGIHLRNGSFKIEKTEFYGLKLPLIPGHNPQVRKRPIKLRDENVHPFPKGGCGHGVYVYENKYYRYEGEWKGGKKHGHGKLLMKDGSYYEGQFYEGEITGNGFRFFAPGQCKYTGQFFKGELHGKGKMIYKDGTIYEGDWLNNRKHGFGVMTTLRNDYYEGSYMANRRHGDGKMNYSNGDRYAGQWLSDKRHGNGELRCADGSVYTGVFDDDLFHGQGVMIHGSGFIYDGKWIRGMPSKIATKLVFVIEKTPMIVRQGRPFEIRIECRTEDDELVTDQGREISLQAGFKHFPPKDGSALFDMIEDVEDKPIKTPFDYDVVPYPLTDLMNVNEGDLQQAEEDEREDEMTLSKSQSQLTLNNEQTEIEDGDQANSEDKESDDKENEKGDDLSDIGSRRYSVAYEASSMSFVDGQTRENTEIPGDANGQENEAGGTGGSPREKETRTMPPPLPGKRTERGVCLWSNLQLAPAPPMYRPFVAMEEAEAEANNVKRTRSRSKVDRFRKEKEKNLEEQYAKIGEYVLMVHDVTNPPFLGRRLEPAFLLIKLKRPLREKKKSNKPKEDEGPRWDTKSHIIESMKRSEAAGEAS